MQELLKHFHELSLHPKNAKELKGLILQLAIQGKLTADWRVQNSELNSEGDKVSDLIEKIKVKKANLVKEKLIRKEKALPSIEEEEIPFEIPRSWEWVRMQDITYLITDGAHHTPEYIDKGIPFLSVKNLSKGFIDFSNTKFISEETHDKLTQRCYPEFEDILLTKIGTTGIAKVIDTKKDFSIFVSVALLKIDKEFLNPYFIENCINSPFIKKQSSDGTEGVGNKNLVLRKIKSFLIPIPPLIEQSVILQLVETLFKEVEALENLTEKRIELKKDYAISALCQLAKNDSKAEWQTLKPQFPEFFDEVDNIKKLRETILQLAVQGKLTATWRAQNPKLISGENSAENLLKRDQSRESQIDQRKKDQKRKSSATYYRK